METILSDSMPSVEGGIVPQSNAEFVSRVPERLTGTNVPKSRIREWRIVNCNDECGCSYVETRVNGHSVARSYSQRCNYHALIRAGKPVIDTLVQWLGI